AICIKTVCFSTYSILIFGCHVFPSAREAAASTYFPIVVALNLGYLFLRLVYQWKSLTVYSGIVTAIMVSGSTISYKGILEDHAKSISKRKGGSEALAGGASLDLLGLLVVVQYGTVFVSEKLYWLLAIIPVWGGWKIYSTFFGSKDGGSGFMPKKQDENIDNTTIDKEGAEKSDAKRQKRAERRRQKWS
ncbi:hypothetical protein ACHAXR_006795, partial [Thalassiosira sp. AJA248-18]